LGREKLTEGAEPFFVITYDDNAICVVHHFQQNEFEFTQHPKQPHATQI
jgi:hypothetical protein